jgi:hypothetical protein
MGLLDDAIREHLELKRRRGADLQAVSRQESDVLGADRLGVDEDGEPPAPDLPRSSAVGTSPGEGVTVAAAADSERSAHVVQETVELDMSTVLDEDEDRGEAREGEPAGPEGGYGAISTADDVVEDPPLGEVPDRGDAEIVGGASASGASEGDPEIEDVLEETPDFLRDTPEQDRLWFEQQAPRDFDFED